MSRFACLLVAVIHLGLVGAERAQDQAPPRAAKPLVQGFAAQRVTEKLDRGLDAVPMSGNRVYLSWRLLDTDPADVTFHVYRRSAGAQPARLTAEPLRKTTDFVDEKPPAGNQEYWVCAVVGGREDQPSPIISATPAANPRPYRSIKLEGDYTFQKVGIADLDGDGRYDFVIKQPNVNVDPYEQYWKKSTDTYKLEAYNADGKFLWRYDLGWSIEEGIWYSPYVVYDLDGDGAAEVAVKTGEGDPRDADGRVQSGPEYLSILDGRTGQVKARIEWPSREGIPSYNYYCRNQLAVGYLDGKTPCLLVQRGTYNTIKLIAYEYHAGKLRQLWSWIDSEEAGGYRGQGAHCLDCADIDGDGRDEVILGSAVIDDNGQGLWATKLGHPDHVYLGDLDPERPGLEIYYGIESRRQNNGMCMVDARTGKILWGIDIATRHVHGQGLCADIDPDQPGCECYSADTDAKKDFAFAMLHDAKGKLLGKENLGGFAPRAAWWDADPQRELVVGGRIRDYNGAEHAPRIEGTIVAVADILGDWREEIITSVAGEMRIYVSAIAAADRRTCLMRDHIYRADVSSSSQAYYQMPSMGTPLPQGR